MTKIGLIRYLASEIALFPKLMMSSLRNQIRTVKKRDQRDDQVS